MASMLALTVLSAIASGQIAMAIQCYQCTISPPNLASNETERLCVNFDYSAQYVVDCPFSTMCMKKSFVLPLLYGESVHGILRDCASQKYDYHVLKDGKWRQETEIEEPYKEGCQEIDDKGARTPPTVYCYCRSHLCNSATSTTKTEVNYHTDAMAVIFVFNAMKYIRSMR